METARRPFVARSGVRADGLASGLLPELARCEAYAKWLSGKTGKAYRMLSDAEWEYSARGQTRPGIYPRYFFGDSEADFCKYGNGADQTAQRQIAGAKKWTVLPCSDGYGYTSPVELKRPNAFGLFDMHGNVWEWVEDCYVDTYGERPLTEGLGGTRMGVARLRGGSLQRCSGEPPRRGSRPGPPESIGSTRLVSVGQNVKFSP